MRVLFLDFDGVIIPLAGTSGKRAPDSSCIAALNSITDATGAQIVISSSWRHTAGIDELRSMLKLWGVRGTVIGQTPSVHGREVTRGDEIAAWMKSHGVNAEDVVILDDQPVDHPLARRQISPDAKTGLTKEQSASATKLFSFEKTKLTN